MNFLQGLGGIGAGLIAGNKILREQKNDEVTNQYRAAMTGLTNLKLAEAQKSVDDTKAYGAISTDEKYAGGTQTIARADAPVDEWGSPQVDTIAKPGDQRGAFESMAAEALKRGDHEGYAKFVKYGDHLKKTQDEGVLDIAKQVYAGAVDPVAAEKLFNSAGQMRVAPGTVKWDADAGVISGVDARSGQPITMDKQMAKQYMLMSGAIKPDEYASAGDGQTFNKRTGEVKGTARGKPVVANGTVLIPGVDDEGNTTMKPVYTAPRQPSVVVHQNDGGGRGGPRLTTPQQRVNEEINAARQALAGMSRDDVLRKTQQATATGRTNPEYDQQLASQWKLANRRKYGDDSQFEQFNAPTEQPGREKPTLYYQDLRQTNQQSDITRRMVADPSMKGMRAGKLDPAKGLEVLDNNGRIIGHYN